MNDHQLKGFIKTCSKAGMTPKETTALLGLHQIATRFDSSPGYRRGFFKAAAEEQQQQPGSGTGMGGAMIGAGIGGLLAMLFGERGNRLRNLILGILGGGATGFAFNTLMGYVGGQAANDEVKNQIEGAAESEKVQRNIGEVGNDPLDLGGRQQRFLDMVEQGAPTAEEVNRQIAQDQAARQEAGLEGPDILRGEYSGVAGREQGAPTPDPGDHTRPEEFESSFLDHSSMNRERAAGDDHIPSEAGADPQATAEHARDSMDGFNAAADRQQQPVDRPGAMSFDEAASRQRLDASQQEILDTIPDNARGVGAQSSAIRGRGRLTPEQELAAKRERAELRPGQREAQREAARFVKEDAKRYPELYEAGVLNVSDALRDQLPSVPD